MWTLLDNTSLLCIFAILPTKASLLSFHVLVLMLKTVLLTASTPNSLETTHGQTGPEAVHALMILRQGLGRSEFPATEGTVAC